LNGMLGCFPSCNKCASHSVLVIVETALRDVVASSIVEYRASTKSTAPIHSMIEQDASGPVTSVFWPLRASDTRDRAVCCSKAGDSLSSQRQEHCPSI